MKKTISRIVPLLAFISLFAVSGCATLKSMYGAVTDSVSNVVLGPRPDPSGLKKKVLVLPFLDHAGMGEEKVSQLTNQFLALFEKDAYMVVHKAHEPLPSTAKIRSPGFGVVTDPDMAKKAEEMGMNVLLTTILNPMEVQTVKTGIWPFRKVKYEIEMSMSVNALDVANGTLVLSNLENEKVRQEPDWVDLEEDEKTKPPEIDEKEYKKMWAKILQRQAEAISSSLKKVPWSGRVISSDSRGIVISAGKDVGLTPDKIFEVYVKGDPIRSADGRAFYFLGAKVGEIKTTDIMENYSSAVPITDAQIKPGHVVRAKN